MLPIIPSRFAIVSATLGLCASCALGEAVEIVAAGDSKELRERPDDAPERSPGRPGLLFIGIDGIDRDLLYDMLKAGELPELAKLIGAKGKRFDHAHFDETTLSTLPSTTMAAWVTALSGEPPARHGITGNEFFVRAERRFVAPVPVSFTDMQPMLENFTDGYTNDQALVPSAFQRMRERDPNVLIWASMLPYHAGADVLLKADRGVLVDALRAFFQTEVQELASDGEAYTTYETIDEETTEAVVELLEDEDEAVADVIAIYYMGADQYAHVSSDGPDRARREYLAKALDPEFAELRNALAARGELDDRFVVVTSDHGHTEVSHDEAKALADGEGDPPEVLERAGFRVRPFELNVADDHDFQAVLAYQGAMAYVYVADRSTCSRRGSACDWKKPPRFEADVLAAADAFFRASRDGHRVKRFRGALDLVLARRPRPAPETDLPFEVYVGNGKLVPIERYLSQHPRPEYLAFEERLRELAVGPAGERAGDVLLIANNGNRERADQRFYFSNEYHSWHGSPCRRDSELPLIVAHPRHTKSQIEGRVRSVLGEQGRQHEIGDLLLSLRYGHGRRR